MLLRSWVMGTAILFALLGLDGCGMAPTVTKRSSIEQLLLVRSLERAVATVDVHPFEGKRVTLDLFGLTADQAFAKAFVAARLRSRGVQIVEDAASAELRLHVFATALAVDQGETLIGIPQTTVPFVAFGIPEIALFKWTRHRGVSELKLYAYDREGHLVAESTPASFGRSRYDQYTVLILIRYSTNDLEEPGDSP